MSAHVDDPHAVRDVGSDEGDGGEDVQPFQEEIQHETPESRTLPGNTVSAKVNKSTSEMVPPYCSARTDSPCTREVPALLRQHVREVDLVDRRLAKRPMPAPGLCGPAESTEQLATHVALERLTAEGRIEQPLRDR